MSRLRRLAADWLVPTAIGLALAAAVVLGIEAGGRVATATVVAAWIAVGAFVVWGIRVLRAVDRELASWDDAPDETLERRDEE